MKSSLKDSQTLENLRTAFLKEATLAYRYAFFSVVADFEGYESFRSLFNEFAEGGRDSVHGCLDFLRNPDLSVVPDSVGATDHNLKTAQQGETELCMEVYPMMAQVAREEGFPDIASWFETLEKLKRAHINKLKKVCDNE